MKTGIQETSIFRICGAKGVNMIIGDFRYV